MHKIRGQLKNLHTSESVGYIKHAIKRLELQNDFKRLSAKPIRHSGPLDQQPNSYVQPMVSRATIQIHDS